MLIVCCSTRRQLHQLGIVELNEVFSRTKTLRSSELDLLSSVIRNFEMFKQYISHIANYSNHLYGRLLILLSVYSISPSEELYYSAEVLDDLFALVFERTLRRQH